MMYLILQVYFINLPNISPMSVEKNTFLNLKTEKLFIRITLVRENSLCVELTERGWMGKEGL